MLLDLLTVKFLGDYLTKPIYFFGKVAIAGFFIALLAMALADRLSRGVKAVFGADLVNKLSNAALVVLLGSR